MGAWRWAMFTDAEEFLDPASYQHVLRWAKAIEQRDAVQQGLAAAR
jgi:glutathione S-transferase